jgi:hypothetical protein
LLYFCQNALGFRCMSASMDYVGQHGEVEKWEGRGILVTNTRNQALGDEFLLAPLYTNSEERTRVVERLRAAFKRTDEEEAELERLQQREEQTIATYWGPLARKYVLSSDGRPPEGGPQAMQPMDLASIDLAAMDRELHAYENQQGYWAGAPARLRR